MYLLTYAYETYTNGQTSERAQITPAPGAQCPSCAFEAVAGCVPDAAVLQISTRIRGANRTTACCRRSSKYGSTLGTPKSEHQKWGVDDNKKEDTTINYYPLIKKGYRET